LEEDVAAGRLDGLAEEALGDLGHTKQEHAHIQRDCRTRS
jgi:hypothetical protein